MAFGVHYTCLINWTFLSSKKIGYNHTDYDRIIKLTLYIEPLWGQVAKCLGVRRTIDTTSATLYVMFQCSTLKYLSKKRTDVHIVLGRCWHQTEWAMANLGIPECTKQVTTNENWWKVFQIYTKTHCTYGQSNHSTGKGIMPNSCNSFSFFRNNSWSNYIRQRTRTNQINRWKKTDDLYNLIRWKVKMCLCACVCVFKF